MNAAGENWDPILIGRAKTPRNCGGDFFPNNGIKYHLSQNAWMTKEIFKKVIKQFHDILVEPVALLLDNFSGHDLGEDWDEFPLISSFFLPPNTTSVTQPLDMGIIRSFKCNYRKRLMEEMFFSGEVFNPKSLSLHKVAPWISTAALQVPSESIRRCFLKAFKTNSMVDAARRRAIQAAMTQQVEQEEVVMDEHEEANIEELRAMVTEYYNADVSRQDMERLLVDTDISEGIDASLEEMEEQQIVRAMEEIPENIKAIDSERLINLSTEVRNQFGLHGRYTFVGWCSEMMQTVMEDMSFSNYEQ